MRSMNRVFLMGYLGHDPELTVSKNGIPYSRLNVATHSGTMNEDDKWEPKTDWHSVFVWGSLAQNCVHNLRRGSFVFVEGSLTYWKVAQGTQSDQGYKNAINGTEVKFLNGVRAHREESAPVQNAVEPSAESENLDFPETPRNHNAVAHPA